jgi:hypothetical protein
MKVVRQECLTHHGLWYMVYMVEQTFLSVPKFLIKSGEFPQKYIVDKGLPLVR